MKKTEKMLKSSNLKSNLKEKINQNPSVAVSKKERGITLIALVVTILVLIILATVSINAVMGDNGLIRRAELVSQYQANAEASDNAALDVFDGYIANAIAGNGGGSQTPTEPENPETPTVPEPPSTGITLEQAKADTMLDKEENTEITIGDDTVWIPAGFKVHAESADTVDEGIIITDGTNEFVWVPVDDTSFNAMFGTVASEPYYLCGQSGETGVKTNYYSNLRVRSGDSSSYPVTTPGTTLVTVNGARITGVREPDLVTEFDSDSFAVQAGYEDLVDMAKGFVEDYTSMRTSIKEYDGFYIGRYELTGTLDNPTVQAGDVLTRSTAKNWYELYKACRDVKENDKYVTSTMIWGCQWDETMNWLKNTKFKGNESAVDSDSSSWGNYTDSTGNARVMKDVGTAAYGSAQPTGYSKEYWSANNICDLAGNYHEWTQEACYNSLRINRGGYYGDSGSSLPASDRSYYNYPDYCNNYYSSRVTLYINL